METHEFHFCQELPKIELHAHLNGSLSIPVLEKLGCEGENAFEYQKLTKHSLNKEERLKECFSLFKIAHKATSSIEAVYKATKYVIQEFYNDNVVYLEIRTTPRSENNMTKLEYIESVIKGIQDSNQDIITKLLLSVDRSHDLKTSEESMEMIIKMKNKYPDILKGVDLSGNPNVGSFDSSLFKKARDCGLFVTLHCAEVKKDSEVMEILNFEPDRIGHGTCLHPEYGGSLECWDLYQAKKVPLECCLTSNVLCGTVSSYKEHHIQEWIKNNLPFSLCTDDKGVFGTSLSEELALAMQHHNLTKENLWNINYNSIDFCFASEPEKNKIRNLLDKWKLKNHF